MGDNTVDFTRHLTGAAHEYMVLSYLSLLGYEIYPQGMHLCRADLVYVRDGKAIRVQVKTGATNYVGKYGYEQVRLITKGSSGTPSRGYTSSEIDEVWVVGTHLWCFPIEFIQGKTSLFLTTTNPHPVHRRRGYNPDDYIIVRGSLESPYRKRLISHGN